VKHPGKVWLLNVLLSVLLTLLSVAPRAYGWGPEGHRVITLIAERDMSSGALERAELIHGGASLEDVANWADQTKRDRR
jgi:S1/P1 Nuclease